MLHLYHSMCLLMDVLTSQLLTTQLSITDSYCWIFTPLMVQYIVLTKENLIKSRLQTKSGEVLNKQQHFSPCFLLYPLFLLFWILKKISAEAAFKIIEWMILHLVNIYVTMWKMSCTLTFSSCWLSFFCSPWLTLLLFFSSFSPLSLNESLLSSNTHQMGWSE